MILNYFLYRNFFKKTRLVVWKRACEKWQRWVGKMGIRNGTDECAGCRRAWAGRLGWHRRAGPLPAFPCVPVADYATHPPRVQSGSNSISRTYVVHRVKTESDSSAKTEQYAHAGCADKYHERPLPPDEQIRGAAALVVQFPQHPLYWILVFPPHGIKRHQRGRGNYTKSSISSSSMCSYLCVRFLPFFIIYEY